MEKFLGTARTLRDAETKTEVPYSKVLSRRRGGGNDEVIPQALNFQGALSTSSILKNIITLSQARDAAGGCLPPSPIKNKNF